MSHLGQIEGALCDNVPFGSSAYIRERLDAHYERRLDALGRTAPWAQQLVARLRTGHQSQRRAIINNPLLRAAIDQAVKHFVLDLPSDETDSAVRFLEKYVRADSGRQPPQPNEGSGSLDLNDGLVRVRVWTEGDDTAESKWFKTLLDKYVFGTGEYLRGLNAGEAAALQQAWDLMVAMLPRMGASAIAHTDLLAVVDPPHHEVSRRMREGSQPVFTAMTAEAFPSTSVLTPAAMSHPWQLVETVLHEGLHGKWFEFCHTHTVFSSQYVEMDPTTMISPPWHAEKGGGATWTAGRAFAAFHVYVHLVVYGLILADRTPGAYDDILSAHGLTGLLESYVERASFLREALLADRCAHAYDFAGRGMLAWLSGVLDSVT